jgi:serine/threonine protein kinase
VQLSNILCDEEAGRCVLTDFGIAAILSPTEDRAVKITQSGELVGDPLWMSPEQLKAEAANERSDIYSLGLVGYHVLAEESPYVWKTRPELYAAHITQPPRKLSLLRPDVDRDLEELLEQCLAKEPSSRPSAAQVEQRVSTPEAGERELVGLVARLVWRRVLALARRLFRRKIRSHPVGRDAGRSGHRG